MTRRILLRAARSPFDTANAAETVQQNLIATNVGNLLFSDAAYRTLATSDVEVVPNGPRLNADRADPDQVNAEYDAFVVPLANAFRPDFVRHLNSLSAFIEKLTIPVTVLGVGAQSDLDYTIERDDRLDAAARRFLNAVLDRGPSVGVRGEYTARYVQSLGYKDVEVIGCPSMFFHGDHMEVHKAEEFEPSSPLALTASPGVADWGARLARLYAEYPNATYFPQNISDLDILLWGDLTREKDTFATRPRSMAHPLLRDGAVRFPLDSHSWVRALTEFEFTLGTRIHGAVASLLAGTPAVVICHDSRTLELCEYFAIPHVRATEVSGEIQPRSFFERADYTEMMTGHVARRKRMTDFIASHGLATVFDQGQDQGAAFDARLAETDFPAPVRPWDGHDDGLLGYRFAWLRDADGKQTHRARAIEQRLDTVERSISGEGAEAGVDDKLAAAIRRIAELDKRIAVLERPLWRRIGGRLRRALRRRA